MALPVQKLNAKLEGEMEFKRKKYSVPFALPGDLVQFRLLRKGRKSKFQVVHIEKADQPPEEIITSSEPGCQHAGICGGCRARHLDYDFQWRWKSAPIVESMQSQYGLDPELLSAPEKEHFRNRMDFAVEGTSIGLRPPQDFETVLALKECPVLRAPGEELLNKMRDLLGQFPAVGWNRKSETGWLKYVTLRIGSHSGVIVLTTSGDMQEGQDFLAELKIAVQELSASQNYPLSIVETVTEKGQELSCTPGGIALHGTPDYVDELLGIPFHVPYDSFFQPNPVAFSRLFRRILELASTELDAALVADGPDTKIRVLDLYCGAGVLSALLLQKWAGINSVLGYEFVQSAVDQAGQRFKDSKVEANFHTLDLNKPESNVELDSTLIVADPPRAGLSPRLCKLIAETRPAPFMLYISCNPETQLRDLTVLAESYEPVHAVLADCFAYTGHMEQAVFLRRRADPK